MIGSDFGASRAEAAISMAGLVLWVLVSFPAIAADPDAETLTTPGAWLGDFSTPRGCTWGVSASAVDAQGRLYLPPDNPSCGTAVGRLIVHDPDNQQFSAVGDVRHNDGPGHIRALQYFNGGVYVGGYFTHIDGVPSNGLARLDTDSGQWSAIGDGSVVSENGEVWTLKVTASEIWISGNFSQAGGQAANRVARFDRTIQQWQALGEGLNQIADALAMDADDRLIAGGRFTEAGGEPAAAVAAWDGQSWTSLAGIQTSGRVRAVTAWDDRIYVGGAFRLSDSPTIGRTLAVWEDGQWSALPGLESTVNSPSGLNAATVFSLARANDMLYVGGAFERSGETELRNVARWDPATETWSALGEGAANGLLTTTGFDAGARNLAVSDEQLYVVGQFTVAGDQPVNNIARFNLGTQNWSPVGPDSGLGINGQNVWSLSRSGAEIIATGAIYQSGLVRTHGIARWNPGTGSWAAFGTPAGPVIWRSVNRTATAGGSVFAAGVFSQLVDDVDNPASWTEVFGLVRWDAASQTWQTLDDSTSDMRTITAMAGTDEDLYVGGNFSEAGGQPANRIARWNVAEQSWFTLGAGLDGAVREIIVTDSGKVYAGGDFLNAGGAPAAGIATWNPASQSWAGLGSGLKNNDGTPARVHAIGIGPGGEVFAAGLFDTAGAVAANNIARWDGNQWQALDSGLEFDGPNFGGIVYALAVADDGDVFAGGAFNRAGGQPANNLARWDGDVWSVLGEDDESNGVDEIFNGVSGLALVGSELYVGGGFNLAGGRPASHFAQFSRDLGGAQVDINIDVEELAGPPAAQGSALATRSSTLGLRYIVDVRNLGQNTARNVDFQITANPIPGQAEWTCQPLTGNAVCPASSGTGLPQLVFNLPGLGTLRFEILVSVPDGNPIYEQKLDVSSTLQPVFSGDVEQAQSSSSTLVNDRIFSNRFDQEFSQ